MPSFTRELDALLRRLRRSADAPVGSRRGSRHTPADRASFSSAKTWRIPARTRSTTRSARPCWPVGWGRRASSRRRAQDSTASQRRRPARCSGCECHVYMGAEDMARQSLNVFRMELLGAEVRRVDAGARTLKDAINEAMRDWVGTVSDSYYLLGSVLGPHPYPLMVREFQSVIGREARAQCLETVGRLPTAIVACVGGGSNAMGIFDAFIDDRDVRLIGVEAGGHGIEPGRHAARFAGGAVGRAPGHAQLRPPGRQWQHRADAFDLGRARLRRGRPRARLAARHGPRRVHVDRRRGRVAGLSAAGDGPKGSCQRSSPRTRSLTRCRVATEMKSDDVLLVNLSGRGDKDVLSVQAALARATMRSTTGRLAETFSRLRASQQGRRPDRRT